MKQSEIETIVNQILLHQQDRSDKAASKTVSNLIGSLETKISEMDRNFSHRLTQLETNTQWINEAFSGGKLLSRISTVIVKFLITVAALSSAIIWIKDWLRK
jgi:hypothetical protein